MNNDPDTNPSANLQRKIFVGYHNNFVHVFETFDQYPAEFQVVALGMKQPSSYQQTMDNGEIYHDGDRTQSDHNNFGHDRGNFYYGKFYPRFPSVAPPWIFRYSNYQPYMMRSTYECHSPDLEPDPTNIDRQNPSAVAIPHCTEPSHSLLGEGPVYQRNEQLEYELQNEYQVPSQFQHAPYFMDRTHKSLTLTTQSDHSNECIPIHTQQRGSFANPTYYYQHDHCEISNVVEAEDRVLYQNMATSLIEERVFQNGDTKLNIGESQCYFENTSVCDTRMMPNANNQPPFSYIDQSNVGNPISFLNKSRNDFPNNNVVNASEERESKLCEIQCPRENTSNFTENGSKTSGASCEENQLNAKLGNLQLDSSSPYHVDNNGEHSSNEELPKENHEFTANAIQTNEENSRQHRVSNSYQFSNNASNITFSEKHETTFTQLPADKTAMMDLGRGYPGQMAQQSDTGAGEIGVIGTRKEFSLTKCLPVNSMFPRDYLHSISQRYDQISSVNNLTSKGPCFCKGSYCYFCINQFNNHQQLKGFSPVDVAPNPVNFLNHALLNNSMGKLNVLDENYISCFT